MKYALCILAHNKPDMLSKLVDRLVSDNTEVFVHLDAKCRDEDYLNIPSARFIDKRTKVFWGGRSMVLAMLDLMEFVVHNSCCDYLLFISGQDFPVVRPADYDLYIDRTKNYLQYEGLPRDCWYMGGLDRIRHYYLMNSPDSVISRALVKAQKIIGYERNFGKLRFKIYGGSQWININREAACYILFHWKPFYKFFRYTRIPDEMFFQTILLNSPLKDTVMNNHHRFIIHKEGEFHPLVLTAENSGDIKASGALFCRKIADKATFQEFEELMEWGGSSV